MINLRETERIKSRKVLNLYAGIGGNRKLWEDVEVTAIEINPDIVAIYKDFFPEDKIIVADAHQYLLNHFREYDFIWSSPPCPTHSQVRFRLMVLQDKADPVYPDMRLYQEIILLKYHFKGMWVVENTAPYYEYLIDPELVGRHQIWSNFYVGKGRFNTPSVRHGMDKQRQQRLGINISKYKIENKRTILRNCVHPEIGLHIFKAAFKLNQSTIY